MCDNRRRFKVRQLSSKIIEWNTCELYSWKIMTSNEFWVDETPQPAEKNDAVTFSLTIAVDAIVAKLVFS